MKPVIPHTTQLEAEVKASDRNARQFAKGAIVILVVFVITTLSFIAYRAITTTNDLKKVIATQGQELQTIQDNQHNNHADNQDQLAAMTTLIQQSEDYNKCLVSLFTHSVAVPASMLETCTPVSSGKPAGTSTAPTSSPAPSTGAQNSSGGTSTPPSQPTQPTQPTKPVVPPVTPPTPAPNLLHRILNIIGL